MEDVEREEGVYSEGNDLGELFGMDRGDSEHLGGGINIRG